MRGSGDSGGILREKYLVHRTETRTVLTSTGEDFVLHADLDAYEEGERVFCQSWDKRIPCNFV